MAKNTHTSLPEFYEVCEHGDCPLAATCLHQIAYHKLIKSEKTLRLINPTMCSKDEKCSFYRDSKPVIYARGFKSFQRRMYPSQYKMFMSLLVCEFGKNPYFERRRGDIALSPREQQIVLSALKQAGVTEEMKFDSYEENINLYD